MFSPSPCLVTLRRIPFSNLSTRQSVARSPTSRDRSHSTARSDKRSRSTRTATARSPRSACSSWVQVHATTSRTHTFAISLHVAQAAIKAGAKGGFFFPRFARTADAAVRRRRGVQPGPTSSAVLTGEDHKRPTSPGFDLFTDSKGVAPQPAGQGLATAGAVIKIVRQSIMRDLITGSAGWTLVAGSRCPGDREAAQGRADGDGSMPRNARSPMAVLAVGGLDQEPRFIHDYKPPKKPAEEDLLYRKGHHVRLRWLFARHRRWRT